MGWLFQYKPLQSSEIVPYLIKEVSGETDHMRVEIVDSAKVGGTVYLAAKVTDKATDTAYTTAYVILFKNSQKDGFGYKDMSETMGPCEASAPDRLLAKLSPVDDLPSHPEARAWAQKWRTACVEGRKAKATARKMSDALKAGDVIRTAAPLSFGSKSFQTFKRSESWAGKGLVFSALHETGEHAMLIRLRPCHLATAERVG